jgi:hypothetical protein
LREWQFLYGKGARSKVAAGSDKNDLSHFQQLLLSSKEFTMKRFCLILGLAALAFLISFSPTARADRVGGPAFQPGVLVTGFSQTYGPVYFVGGRIAIVSLNSDRINDLTLVIRDGYGNAFLLGAPSVGLQKAASWVPPYTGYYYVSVQNNGAFLTSYSIETN